MANINEIVGTALIITKTCKCNELLAKRIHQHNTGNAVMLHMFQSSSHSEATIRATCNRSTN